MKFLIKFPTRSRREKFFYTLDKYISLFSPENDFRVLVSCDYDDVEMNNLSTIDKLKSYEQVCFFFDKRTNKIDAINRDIDKVDYQWDILISAADDMIPVKLGYDKVIVEEMNKNFSNLDGALWFYDGFRKDINTQSIMGKNYYNQFGYIYHPSYLTWFCDDEYTEVGKRNEKLIFVDKCIIRHEYHNTCDGVSFDKLYQENERPELKLKDQENYRNRQQLGFP